MDKGDQDRIIYKVLKNHQDQYMLWRADRENPRGWQRVGKMGTRKECLTYVIARWAQSDLQIDSAGSRQAQFDSAIARLP